MSKNLHSNHQLLDEYRNSNDSLKQFGEKFNSNYFWYNCWLYLTIAVSGYALFHSFGVLSNSFKYSPPDIISNNLRDFAFYMSIFAQFILEKWAIYSKDSSIANFTLNLMIINTIISFGLVAFFGYALRQTYIEVSREDVGFIRGVLISAIVIASVFTIPNVLFTIIPAIKIRGNFQERKVLLATLEVSQTK